MIGLQTGLVDKGITLATNETINKIQIRAGRWARCSPHACSSARRTARMHRTQPHACVGETALSVPASNSITHAPSHHPQSCVEYLRFYTSNSRSLIAGNAASSATLVAAYPNKAGGFLGTFRGYEMYTKVRRLAPGSCSQSAYSPAALPRTPPPTHTHKPCNPAKPGHR